MPKTPFAKTVTAKGAFRNGSAGWGIDCDNILLKHIGTFLAVALCFGHHLDLGHLKTNDMKSEILLLENIVSHAKLEILLSLHSVT